ncbi:MAG: hypothetical protein ACK56I_12985, partial [bacterium]
MVGPSRGAGRRSCHDNRRARPADRVKRCRDTRNSRTRQSGGRQEVLPGARRDRPVPATIALGDFDRAAEGATDVGRGQHLSRRSAGDGSALRKQQHLVGARQQVFQV